MKKSILKLCLLAGLLTLVGCNSSVETGVVTGVVTKSGKPLEQVMVYFMPDPEKETKGAHSTAITDDQGRYELMYYGENHGPGAAIGWHRVTLEDMIPENFRGAGAPPRSRVPEKMSKPWQTPLNFEVKAGEQEIPIDVGQG